MLTDNLVAPLLLVVEDDTNHAELIHRSFEDAPESYRLEIAGTIGAAKKVIERNSPSLVLTDYRLPDGDGSELVVAADGLWPVIMMTSHGSEQIAVEAMKIGAQDYIAKSPEMFEKLPGTVKFALMSWALTVARRQVTETVFRAKTDWERTFDAVPEMISIIDVDHTITRCNKAMADRCGLAPGDLVGRKCCEVVHGLETQSANCPVSEMMLDGLVHNREIHEKSLNGIFDVTVSPLHDENGRITAFVHVMKDISERKRAEEEHQRLEQQYQQTQKLESLGVLAGGIAHDFNNILTIILGHCFMVNENFDSGMTARDHVQLIESAANRAADLCRQMLAYAGQSPQVQTKVNMWLLVDEVVKMLTSAIKKNIAIELDLKRDVPELTGDSAQIQQIVMNLIINAAEAIGDKNGTIRVTLKKIIIQAGGSDTDFMGTLIPARRYACLEVSDTGCGITDDVKKRIFEPFFTTKFTGRGLGMSAILGIVKSHDGALQLASTPGAGSTFTVYLPLPDTADVVETSLSGEPAPAVTVNGTVLLVDDEEALRTIGSALLSAMGFSVMIAANGRKALDIYRERGSGIDLILLDLIMPEMGGIDTYHALRKMSREVPIVICSGYGAESVEDVTTTDDKTCFLRKPYNPVELRRILNERITCAHGTEKIEAAV